MSTFEVKARASLRGHSRFRVATICANGCRHPKGGSLKAGRNVVTVLGEPVVSLCEECTRKTQRLLVEMGAELAP